MKTWPRWAIYTVGAVFLVLAAAGTCTKVAGPIWTPTPAPLPKPRPSPSDVWKSLDPPTSNVIAGVIELPAPMEINASRRYIPVTAKCDNDVQWLVSSSHSGSQVDALESTATNTIMIFPKPNTEDTIVVLAYTAKSDKPTSAVITFIRVKADKPPPLPGPTPDPSPDPQPTGSITKLHVTFLLNNDKQTRAISDVVNSKDLRDWLSSHDHEIHELSSKDNLDVLGLTPHVKGKSPPLCILQTQAEPGVTPGQVLKVIPVTTVQDIKDTIIKVLGK